MVKQIVMMAFAALMAQCVWAATPVVVWDGDFKTDTKTGTNNDTYKLVVNGNTVADDATGSSITIADTERKGVYINWSTTTDAATILVKYSGLTTDNKTYPMGLIGFSNGNKQNIDGLAIHDSSRELKAYWNDTYFYSSGTPKITMDGSVTKFALKYSSAGTHSRSNQSGSWETLYANSKIMGGGTYALNGAVVGGSRALSYNNMDLQVATGMQIVGIAIFNSILSDDDIAGYYFPSEVAKIGNVVYTSLSEAITAAGSDETTITLIKSVSESVTIPANVTVETQSATELSGTLDGSGKIKVAALAENTPRFTFADTWSGTVEIAALTQGNTRTQLMDWGTAKSKIVYKGLSGSAIWVGSTPIKTTIQLDGAVEINNGSSAASYTLNTVTGSGNLTLASWGGCRNGNPYGVTYAINTLSDYTGNLAVENRSSYASGGAFKLVIGNIVKTPAPAYGEKILSLTRACTSTNQQLDYDVSSTKLNGETAPLVLKDDGVYLASAMVGETPYATLQDAVDAAANGDMIELLAEAHLEGLSVSGKAVIIVHTKTVSGTTQYFLKLGSAYIGEQKDSGAIPLLNSVDVPGGDKISPAVDAECVTKYTYSSGDHTWKQPIAVGDLTKCVALATASEYIPTTTKKPYLISYFISKNITLEDDMELPLRTTISGSLNFCGDNLVFNLNGHTLKQGAYVNGYPAVAVKVGSLTIKDSVGNGKIIGATNGLNVENGSQCVVESGSIMTMGCWKDGFIGSCVQVLTDAEIRITGGTFGDDANYVENPKTSGTLLAMNGTATITGGEFRAPTNEKAWDGTAICAYSYTAGKTASVTISGDPVVYGWVYPYQTAGSAAMSISGGQFDKPVNKYYGKLTVDGYEVVINDNGLYEPLPKTPDLEITVSEDGQTITPSVTSEGTVVVVNQETLDETSVIPQMTGLYGVIVKNVAGKATGTSLIGVVKVQEAVADKKTIAVAVPFTGATVENLLNTKLLNEGDELKAYVDGAYSMWSLDATGKWVSAKTVKAGGTETAPDAETTPLKRGTAVWVTTAGQVVTLGMFDAETEIVAEDEGVNLLGNPTMTALEPAAKTVGDNVVLMDNTRYTAYGTTANKVWVTMQADENDPTVVRPVERNPSVEVGKGYWMIRK